MKKTGFFLTATVLLTVICGLRPAFGEIHYQSCSYVPGKVTCYLNDTPHTTYGTNEGTDKLIDRIIPSGTSRNKMCATNVNINKNSNTFSMIYQTTDLRTRWLLDAYTFGTADDASGRDPNTWKLYGSNNGKNWIELDSKTGQLVSATRNTQYDFAVTGQEKGYSQYKISVTKTTGDEAAFQLSELAFWGSERDVAVQVPVSSATVTLGGTAYTKYYAHETPAKLLDGDLATKFCAYDLGSGLSDTNQLSFVLELSEAADIGLYSFGTANDNSNRDPKSWSVYGSRDGSDWVLLDSVSGAAPSSDRGVYEDYDLVSDTEYQFYRFDFSATRSDGYASFQLGELQLYQFRRELPEPSAWCLMLLGAGLIFRRKFH